MAELLRFGVEHGPGPVHLAVVLELERIAADKNLRGSHKAAQGLLIALQQVCVHRVRCVTGHDQQHGDWLLVTAGRFHVVGQALEHQPLIESPEGSLHLTEVIGRADNQPVRLTDGVQHLRQPIPADTVSLVLLPLATEAGDAAGISLQPE